MWRRESGHGLSIEHAENADTWRAAAMRSFRARLIRSGLACGSLNGSLSPGASRLLLEQQSREPPRRHPQQNTTDIRNNNNGFRIASTLVAGAAMITGAGRARHERPGPFMMRQVAVEELPESEVASVLVPERVDRCHLPRQIVKEPDATKTDLLKALELSKASLVFSPIEDESAGDAMRDRLGEINVSDGV